MPPPPATHAVSPTALSLPAVSPPAAVPAVVDREPASGRAQRIDPRAWTRVRLLLDTVTLGVGASAALFAAPGMNETASRWTAVCFAVIALAALHSRRCPDDRLQVSLLDTATHVLGATSVAAMFALAGSSILDAPHTVGLAVRLWLFATVYAGGCRIVLVSVRRQMMRHPALAVPTLVVGAGQVGVRLVRRLLEDTRYGLRPVGFLDADPLAEAVRSGNIHVPVVGRPDELCEAARRTGARRVILAFWPGPDRQLIDAVAECQARGVEVSLIPRLFESVSDSMTLDHVGGVPLLSLHATDPRGLQFAIKHGFDKLFAGLALLTLAPVMALIALAVRATSPGPILFRQRRIGRDGQEFDLLKFRSMRDRAAGAHWRPPKGTAPGGVEGEDRRTPIGRFLRESSLDELPQLINVLRGEMSLVGPRPERPEFVQLFSTEIERYEDRHRVRSGITGWAQVNGLRGQTSISDRVEWDNYYIRNWSLWLDLRIIALTIAEVLRFRG